MLADVYDQWVVGVRNDTEQVVSFLAKLAEETGRAPLLELGIGTGRVALPLAERGYEVWGIEASDAMIERLRAKPGSDAITVVRGDFADVAPEGPFGVVFVVFNTFFGLADQDEQVRCFQNAAARLRDGGAFVVQAFVPDVARFESGMTMEVAKDGDTSMHLGMSRHDRVAQLVWPRYEMRSNGSSTDYEVRFRYAWPSELDLMARLAGLTLESRFGDWNREPFTASSMGHVSVYRKAAS
ncbi:MAG: class I SAM-dependent methyltransferase [Actinomadura rubrobrunea]|nr:class I SAM-dependent methyltransferase [Actinomadura rubrobrunea]